MKTLFFVMLFALSSTISFANEQQSGYLQANKIQSDKLQADFTQLYTDLKASHINLFANVSKAQYDTKYAEIKKQLSEPLSPIQAQILFQQFVAFGNIAHAYIPFPDAEYTEYREQGGTAFPIYVRIKNDKWFVSEDYSSHGLKKDTQITHINGKNVDAVFKALRQHISSDTSDIAASLLEFMLPKYLWLQDLQQGAVREATTICVVNDEKSRMLDVKHLTRKELQNRIDAANTLASNLENKQQDENTEKLREFTFLSSSVAYLKPGPFYNAEDPADVWNNTDFVAFIDSAFESFIEKGAKALVIDVRNNPGGTNSFSDPLIAWFANQPFKFTSTFLIRSSVHAKHANQSRIDANPNGDNAVSLKLAQAYESNPAGTVFEFNMDKALPRKDKQFEGDIFVLIDRTSYSNAVSLAAIVKDYGFGKVIGQPSVDFATTYASMETFTLNNTGIQVGFPKAHIIRPSGDTDAGPVTPDVVIEHINLDTLPEILDNL
ncbi:S41 family peptidase [Glaciecola sp. KUL10]|uniref:S41 family peptidase n=1 Tax=Glaciecola sp. (strain KUL10) TaxID=2161813 RepID=UPI000D789BD9|nr:S41 family peptidase [Glaciecola sp. KUL10]GBL04490.1 peptidase S41 [Glaciecola sp. KUL10]